MALQFESTAIGKIVSFFKHLKKNIVEVTKESVKKSNFQALFLILVALFFPLLSAITRNLYSEKTANYIPFFSVLVGGYIFLYYVIRCSRLREVIRTSFFACLMLVLIVSQTFAFGRNPYIDRYGSIYPFLYNSLAAFIFLMPVVYLMFHFFSQKTFYYFFSRYPLWFPVICLPYFWIHTENGWQPLLLIFGVVFYPTKYTLALYLFSLILAILSAYIDVNKFGKKQKHQKPLRHLYLTLALVYLCTISVLPFILPKQTVRSFQQENRPAITSLNWGCTEYKSNEESFRQCLAKKTANYPKRYLFKSDIDNIKRRPLENPILLHPKILTSYKSIKDCFATNTCYTSGDKFGFFSVNSSPFQISGILDLKKRGNTPWEWADFETYPGRTEFWPVYNPHFSDVVIIENNAKKEVFYIAKLLLNLDHNMVLADILLVHYKQTDRKFTSTQYTKMQNFRFEKAGTYRFSLIGTKSELSPRKNDLHLSIDNRENPSLLLIKNGETVYGIDFEQLTAPQPN